MKKFEMHQKDAIMAKMNDLSCTTIFVSYDNGDVWEERGIPCEFESDSMDTFNFDAYALYVASSAKNLDKARACLIDSKVIEVTGYSTEEVVTITKENILKDQNNWLSFSRDFLELSIKKDPIVMWVAATADSCSKPHNSCAELAKKLSLEHDGEITDGQVVGGFTFNMIKVEL